MAGRAGALRSWANTGDKTARTQPARDAFLERFEREVDPEGKLPEKQRTERAIYARRAYMIELARRSAQVRREKARARKGQPDEALEDDGCAVISIHYRNRAGTPAGAASGVRVEADLAEQQRKLAESQELGEQIRRIDGCLYPVARAEAAVCLAGPFVSIGRGVAGQHLAGLPAEISHDVVIRHPAFHGVVGSRMPELVRVDVGNARLRNGGPASGGRRRRSAGRGFSPSHSSGRRARAGATGRAGSAQGPGMSWRTGSAWPGGVPCE